MRNPIEPSMDSKELRKVIGDNIKSLRKQMGYNQELVSNHIGGDRSLISRYEAGERPVSLVHLKKLANLFFVSVEDLCRENAANSISNTAFSFRIAGLNEAHLKSISSFQEVVKNYCEMVKIKSEWEKTLMKEK